MSKGCSKCSRELGTARLVSHSDTTASAAGRTNSQRQFTMSTMNDDTKRPTSPPLPATPAQMPIAWARSSSGNVEVITDSVTGMIIDAPMPATTRAAIMNAIDGASAAPTLDRKNSPRPLTSTGLRPHRSPIAPKGMSSEASATV